MAIRDIDASCVRWCYWKAADGVDAALGGFKDFDLLTDPRDIGSCEEHLMGRGFRRFVSPPVHQLPSVSHFVAPGRGKQLLHVHLHGRIFTGRPRLMEWELPWAEYILDHRVEVIREALSVFLPAPPIELLLLAIRTSVEPKQQCDGAIRPVVARRIQALRASIPANELTLHARALIGPDLGTRLGEVIGRDLSDPAGLRQLREVVLPALAPHRRRSIVLTSTLHAAHVAESASRAVYGRLPMPRLPPERRGLRKEPHGLIIAVIGPDGAGKSTAVQEVREWLSPIIEVQHLYGGRGDWIAVARQLVADAKWAVVSRATSRSKPVSDGPSDDVEPAHHLFPSRKENLVALVRDLQRIELARRKYRDVRRAARARANGVVVICDRYPHPQLAEYDGPAIPLGRDSVPLRRALRALERHLFERMAARGPDVVIRLRIAPDVAHARKPDHKLRDIVRKACALDEAYYPGAAHFELDASRPQAEVVEALKSVIWSSL